MRRPLKIAAMHAGLLLGVVALMGACGGAGDFCQKAQECEGGNEMDLDACAIDEQAEADIAELHNCSSEYENYFACKEENSRCNNKVYQHDPATCKDLSDAYQNCVNH